MSVSARSIGSVHANAVHLTLIGRHSCAGPGSPQRRPLRSSRQPQRCRSPRPRPAPQPAPARPRRPSRTRRQALRRLAHPQVAREVRRPRPGGARRSGCRTGGKGSVEQVGKGKPTARSPRPATTGSSWCSPSSATPATRRTRTTRRAAPSASTGPLHNEIPKPDRKVDNSTMWDSNFDRRYYENMYFNRMKRLLQDQSSGQVHRRRRRDRVGEGPVQRGPLRQQQLRRLV